MNSQEALGELSLKLTKQRLFGSSLGESGTASLLHPPYRSVFENTRCQRSGAEIPSEVLSRRTKTDGRNLQPTVFRLIRRINCKAVSR